MNRYLLPHKFKQVGWMLLIPSLVAGLWLMINDFEVGLSSFKIHVPALVYDGKFLIVPLNNVFDEIIAFLLILSSFLVAFSRLKVEDEFTQKIRQEALVWALFVNYALLLLGVVFVYGISFFYISVFNLFGILIFFIAKFHWKLRVLNSSDAF